MKNSALQLKDVIKYLRLEDDVVLWQTDIYTNKDEEEIIYEGSIIDIPWIYLDFYLVNTCDSNAIGVGFNENNKSEFIITLCEDYNRLPKNEEDL